MNRSEILIKAHKMAKGAIRNGKFNGIYKNALSWAMKKLYAEKREQELKKLESYKIGNITVNLRSFAKTEEFYIPTISELRQAKKALTVLRSFTTVQNGVNAELVEISANGVTQTLFWNSAIKRTEKLNQLAASQAWEQAEQIKLA